MTASQRVLGLPLRKQLNSMRTELDSFHLKAKKISARSGSFPNLLKKV